MTNYKLSPPLAVAFSPFKFHSMKATNRYFIAESNSSGRRKFPNFFILLAFLLFCHMTCSPPKIQNSDLVSIPETSVDSIYANARDYLNKPIRVTCVVTASFFVQPLGGFYFIEDTDGEKSMIAFTKQPPPQDGDWVTILGIIRPALLQDDYQLLYLKEKEVFVLSEAYAY